MVQHAAQVCFDFFQSKGMVVEAVDERLSGDAGLLVLGQLDRRLNYSQRIAACLTDGRRRPTHAVIDMVRQRLFAVIAGYEDCNDHDRLCDDPVLKLLADRGVADGPLASQQTLSRFENAITPAMLFALEALHRQTGMQRLIDLHARRKTSPCEITIDLDAFDDPTHGQQQLSLFHGHYDQHQYLPLVITEPTTRHVFGAFLRHGTAHAALGAAEVLEQIIADIHARWPHCRVHLRADSGFATAELYALADADPRVRYTLGYRGDSLQKARAELLLERARQQYAQTGMKSRLFDTWLHQAKDWPRPRRIIAKAEVGEEGTNLRFIVCDLAGPSAAALAETIHDAYIQRGTSEQRIDELKNELHTDRLSCHRFMANAWRLQLHVAAYNLFNALRDHDQTPAVLRSSRVQVWRTRLFKLAARIHESTRRVVISASRAWPFWDLFRRLANRALLPAPAS